MPQKRTIPRTCERCGKNFLISTSEHNRGGNKGRFCSHSCGRGNRIRFACQVCGRPCDVPASWSNNPRFCSKACKRTPTPNEITVSPDGLTAQIALAGVGSPPRYAVIDTADIPLAARERWYFVDGYARSGRSRGGVRLHRRIMGLAAGDLRIVDHIDRDRLNCRRSNLRLTSHAGNAQNTSSRCGSTSVYRGVSWNTRQQKWVAQIRVNGKKMGLGVFTSEHEAAEVARAARARLMPYAID